MIRLERHIEILLLSNDCVIVPDFGGFMAHQVCARYDEEEAMFLPPLRTLGFNQQLKLNDSLLAQSYVEAYDISYPEALRRIADEVRELKQHLYNEGSYTLNNLGKLYINDGGCLSFEPCEAGILTPSLYGLDSFDFTTLPIEIPITHAKEEKKPTSKEESLNNALKNIVVDDTSVFLHNDEKDDSERSINIKLSWIRNAAISVAVLIFVFLIATPLSDYNKTGVTMSNLSNEIFTNMMPKDTSKGDLKMDVSQDSSFKHSEDSVKTVVANSSKPMDANRYCIILASRITRKNAERFVDELKKSGINDAYTYVHNDIVRVAYGKFGNEKDAQDSLRKLRDNSYFEQAWVYELK